MRHLIAMIRAGVFLTVLLGRLAAADVLHDHDNGPLTGIFGLPDSTEGGALTDVGSLAWTALVTTSSHSIEEAAGSEALVFDGETTRMELRLLYGLSSRLELGVELPYMWQQSGSLDSAIDGWHSFFGLPDGARANRPRDVLEYLYLDEAGTQLNIAQNSHGIGDLRLFAGYRVSTESNHRTALRFGVKFPTGSAVDLHGSGGTDVSVGFAGDIESLWGSERLSGFYRLHAMYLGEPEWLADRYQEWAGQLSGGLHYRVSQAIALAVQGTVRSALYDVDVDSLGDPAATITFGGSVQMSDRWQLELAVGEDIRVGSGPDVSFQLGLRYASRP